MSCKNYRKKWQFFRKFLRTNEGQVSWTLTGSYNREIRLNLTLCVTFFNFDISPRFQAPAPTSSTTGYPVITFYICWYAVKVAVHKGPK